MKFHSKRTGLWMLPQDNEIFKQTFRQHSAEQRTAAKRGDYGKASHSSKLKTKEFRYSVHVDALKKGFKQKIALEEYRQKVITIADEKGQHAVVEAVSTMCILALRDRVLDKDPELAKSMLLPLWPRPVSSEAARVGNLATTFLAEQSKIIRTYVFGRSPEPTSVPTAPTGGLGTARIEATLEAKDLRDHLDSSDRTKVITAMAH